MMVSQTDSLAYSGGALLACCLLPQLRLMWVNQSAHDVSFSWTIFYITGLVLTMVYLIEVDAYAGWVGLIPEIILAIFVLASKIYLDRRSRLKEDITKVMKDDASSYNVVLSKLSGHRSNVIMEYSNLFIHDENYDSWIVDVMETCLLNSGILIQKNLITTIPSRVIGVYFLNDGCININHCNKLGVLNIVTSIYSNDTADIVQSFYEKIQSKILTKFPDCLHTIDHFKMENPSSKKIPQVIKTVSQNNNIEENKDLFDSV